MDDNINKRIYFIFSQGLSENNSYHLEKSDIINSIEILKQKETENYSYTLYSISVNNNNNIKSFSLLLNKENEYFMAQIDCNKVYPEIFLYKIDFKPKDKNTSIKLNQITLPFSEQFYIFQSHFLKEKYLIKYLLLNSFDLIAISNQKIKFELYFFLFLFGNSLNLNIENSKENMLISFFNFFGIDLIDVENSYKKGYFKNEIVEIMGKNIVELLSDISLVYPTISSMISDNENKEEEKMNLFEIILAYYYLNFNKRSFIRLLNLGENPRSQLTKNNLIKNRKIFKNFSYEILNFDLLDEAMNLSEIHSLFLLAPSLPELIKIMSEYTFFIKLCNFAAIEHKIVNVYKIIKPKKDDDVKLLYDCYNNLCEFAMSENYAPFVLCEDLFFSYCEFYFQEDLNKMELIIKLYYKNCEISPNSYNQKFYEELYNYYNETGLFLIKSGKLINKDLLTFLETKKKLFNKEIIITEEIGKGLVPSNDSSFLETLLNPKDKSLIELVKYYFNKFTIKDFLNHPKEIIFQYNNSSTIKYCLDGFKNALLKEKGTKIGSDISKFFAKLLCQYFGIYKTKEDIEEFKIFENELNNPKFIMNIFGITILENFTNGYMKEFNKHIFEYIEAHYMEIEYIGLYYKVLIIEPEERVDFLLNNLSYEFAIKLEDYLEFPNKMHPRIDLFVHLYNAKFLNNKIIQNTEYYKSSINTKDNLTTFNYKTALNISKNIQEYYKLFLFFIPNRYSDDEDYLIANILFDFNDQVDYCKSKYNSLKKVLSYYKHFFKVTKKNDIHTLEELIQQLENTPIKDFNKNEIKIDSLLVDINEAERNDVLVNSFFFMGIYIGIKNLFPQEEEDNKFKYCLCQFNEIQILGKHSDIESIPLELQNLLIELVYKNKDRLDDELDFIKDYFNFEDNPNFDINRIKRSFLNKVNNYQKNKNLGDYEIDFDKFNLIEENPDDNNIIVTDTGNSKLKSNEIQTKKNDTDDGGFSLFSNNDGNNADNNDDDDEFTLLGNYENKNEINKTENKVQISLDVKKEVSQNLNVDQMKKLLKDLNLSIKDYYYIYRIYKSSDDYEDNYKFNNSYYNFFLDIFNNIAKYDSLSNKQFYEEVIIVSMKIFLSGVGINYFKNENNQENDIYLIYEFFEILEMYKKYNLLSKKNLFKIIEKIIEYQKNEDGEAINIIGSIENLFTEIGENMQKKSISPLFIKLLCMEKNKVNINEFNHKLIEFTFRNDNNYLFNDIIPLLDEFFKEDIKSKVNILDYFDDKNKYIYFPESIYEPIEKALNNPKEPKITKDLEEIILYYFESKISYIFSKIKKEFENKSDFYKNEYMESILKKCLFLLEDEYYKQLRINNKKLSILFNIAFIKCYLTNYIYNLFNFNQEMGNVKDINENIIKGNGNNPFRTTIKLYILKLFYNLLGNYPDFTDFNYVNYQIDYFKDKEINNLYNPDDININNNMNQIYGFDYLFLPIEENGINELKSIEKNMINMCVNNIKENDDLIMMINHCCTMDIFLCSIINILISNYKNKYYFESNTYKNISSFLYDNLTNDKLIRIKNILKDVLLLFIDKNKYENNVLKNDDLSYRIDSFSYNQILSISIALRFVFNTLLSNNQNSSLYQLFLGSENILTKKNIFISYYNNDYASYKSRNINKLTFSIIKFIIISHIYIGFLLKNISLSNINNIFINPEENMRLIDIIENDFNYIRKILELKGIKNIIVFMNNIFNDIKSIILEISLDINDELNIKDMETKTENEVTKYLDNFSFYMDEYDKKIEKIDINNNMPDNKEFRKIITEKKKFYNDINIDKKYPFIQYLTLTNFSGIDDFKQQFLNLVNEKSNYPLINCLVNNDDIIVLSKNIAFINEFFNEINNELTLKIRRDDVEKNIGMLLSENIKIKINEYNDKIKEINELKTFKTGNKINEIDNNTKIIDVINIKDNLINKMFDSFIKIYNEFLTNTKIYKDNKNIIESIIIQEATKDDFFNFHINEKPNPDNYNQKDKSIYDRLDELLYLYSKRNRYYKNDLNVYSKGKINYDLAQIENILEKEYLYGKKPFKTEQRNFIFSNEVFSGKGNNIIEELINKYPQEDIKDDMMKSEIDKFFNDGNKTKNDLQRINISLQYIIIFLVNYEINLNDCNGKKISLDYIAKIIRKKNYKINELLAEFINNYQDILINHLLIFYEKAEIKYFSYVSEEIGRNNMISPGESFDLEEYFKQNNNNLLLNEEKFFEGIKKYIMRYCMGDNHDKKDIIKNLDINKIFEKKCIWHFLKKNEEQENQFQNEVDKLIKLNQDEKNYLINYILKKLFEKKLEGRNRNEIVLNNDDVNNDE